MENSQPPDVRNRPEAPYSALRLLNGFMMEMLHKGLHIIYLYDVVAANIFKDGCTEKVRRAYGGISNAAF